MPDTASDSSFVPRRLSLSDIETQRWPWARRKLQCSGQVADLARSIRSAGPITPVVVARTPDGEHQLVSGALRVHAARDAGLEEIPVRLRDASVSDIPWLYLHSNESPKMRSNSLHLAWALDEIQSEFERSADGSAATAITSRISALGRSTVYSYLRVGRLVTPGFVTTLLEDGCDMSRILRVPVRRLFEVKDADDLETLREDLIADSAEPGSAATGGADDAAPAASQSFVPAGVYDVQRPTVGHLDVVLDTVARELRILGIGLCAAWRAYRRGAEPPSHALEHPKPAARVQRLAS